MHDNHFNQQTKISSEINCKKTTRLIIFMFGIGNIAIPMTIAWKITKNDGVKLFL